MRKSDKKLNIQKANLLSEQRYVETKNLMSEDWKTNLAAGLATAGAVAGGNAQTTKSVDPNQQSKTIQHNPSINKDINTANPFKTDISLAHPRTLPIVDIQTGVTDGKTGKPSVYVYHKDKNSPDFDVKRDRETVYVDHLDDLRKTKEYQDYRARLQNKDNQIAGVDENNILDEMDYERKITINDFRWVNQFPGWYPTELSDGVVSIKNDNYPKISFEVSIADYNNGGHQSYGTPTNKQHPWKFTVKKAVNPDSFVNKNFAPEGFIIVDGGQTSNIESSFDHFLKNDLRFNINN